MGQPIKAFPMTGSYCTPDSQSSLRSKGEWARPQRSAVEQCEQYKDDAKETLVVLSASSSQICVGSCAYVKQSCFPKTSC